ncbi:MAG: exopolysaccharide biosynthesis polyprenyl glycosylphosphotransferase [Chlorobi bacterium OLB5]|nr:MAG: exopolysaccharide biosynthesis polyprenyl glycosylphosphotransferase [Chlorobi bacterium OLB5]
MSYIQQKFNKKSQRTEFLIPLLNILSDSFSVFLAFITAYWIRFYFAPFVNLIPFEGVIPPISGYIKLALIVIPVWLLIFQSRKMFRPKRIVFIFDEFFLIGRLATFGIIFSFGLIFFYRVFPYSRVVFVMVWLLSIIFITIGRYLILKYEKTLYNRGRGLKDTIIAGNNQTALDIFNKFSKHKYAGFNITGYVDDNAGNDFLPKNLRLGSYGDLVNVIQKNNIETVLVAIPSSEHDKLFDLMKAAEGENVEFLMVPDFLEVITSSVRVQEVDGIPLLKIKSIPMNIWNRIMKRIFDFIFALSVMLLTSPLFILLSALVKFTSKGPVFYKQERLSMTGRKFQMIKFRSMVTDAEKETGAVYVKKGDSRYTPIGEILRKYSLDELPQFINVLKGDMSIVGPRPEREHFINLFKNKIPKYLERHRIKCGITGWAQVNGLRGSDSSIEKRIEYDIYYIEHWSIIFDLKIIIKTIKEMFFSKAAY